MPEKKPPVDETSSETLYFPKTVNETVDLILAQLSLEEMAGFAKTSVENLEMLSHVLAVVVQTKIEGSTLNQELVNDCRRISGNPDLDVSGASKVVIEAIWKRLRETHRLRVTCPPKTGPDFVREIWHNLRPKSGGGYESEAVHHGEDYRDAESIIITAV